VNAGAIGVDRPFIVLNSGTLALLNEAEVQFVVGHELGLRGAHSRAQDFGRKVWASLRRDRQCAAATPGPAAKRAPRKATGRKAAGRRSRARPISKKRGR
jgi:hypothetical protein